MKHLKQWARLIGVKTAYHAIRDFILKQRGFHLLSLEQTAAFMKPYQLSVFPESNIQLPEIADCADPSKILFTSKQSNTTREYIWEYKDTQKKAQISRYGSIIIRRKVLCTDRTHESFYTTAWEKDHRPVKIVPAVIAPFSHYQSEFGFGGYFDFVFSVLVKFCRIKDALPSADFSDMAISYVPFNTPYEKEYLELLGFNPANIIDSRVYKVVSPRLLTGSSRNWHPNSADIESLKRHIAKKFTPVKTASHRIYISRSERRRVVNEEELITLLKKFDFIIIEDKQRSITEQITLYHNASFIIGPHGASFGNIIWCEPGTHLFELFSPNYVPDFFVYLTTLLKMNYSAYYEGMPDSRVNYLDSITEDIHVSIPQLEQCLKNTLKTGSDAG